MSKNVRWTTEEETLLLEEVKKGLSVEEIAKKHQRSVGGITSRIKKLKPKVVPDRLATLEKETVPKKTVPKKTVPKKTKKKKMDSVATQLRKHLIIMLSLLEEVE